jgi:cytoskeletal protein RodZ
MAVFNNSSSEIPESQIEYNDNNGARRWVVLLVYIVLALVVATLVVLAGRWVYHKVSNNSGPAPTTIAPQGTNQGVTTSPNPATPSPTNKSPNPSPPPSSGSKTTTPNPSSGNKATSPAPSTPPTTPNSLPNNGPGEMIAAFLGATLLGYGFDALMTKRRQQKSQV